jgi:hypothetical protein
MARSSVPRRSAVAKVGNYSADIDTTGMSDEDKTFFTGTKANKIESDYIKGTGRASAVEAVKRARRANKQPPLKGA